MNNSPSPLIIIPCSKTKIWDQIPDAGPTPAKDAYTSSYFRLNRQYAETFTDSWRILSAKYGLLHPDQTITAYNATFNHPGRRLVTVELLQEQILSQNLRDHLRIIGLGGKAYRTMLKQAFAPTEIEFPFAGLTIGKAMQAVKAAIDVGLE